MYCMSLVAYAIWTINGRRPLVNHQIVSHDITRGPLGHLLGFMVRTTSEQSQIYAFGFDPHQSYKVHADKTYEASSSGKGYKAVAVDRQQWTLHIKQSKHRPPPHVQTPIPGQPPATDPQRQALQSWAQATLDGDATLGAAALALLERRPRRSAALAPEALSLLRTRTSHTSAFCPVGCSAASCPCKVPRARARPPLASA
jgi:hypothetical protein